MTPRVAVFLYYQNVHLSACTAFLPSGTSGQHGHVDPMRVARRIVRGRRLDGEFAAVRVYRGRPSPDHQPVAARAADRQADRWSRDPHVVVVRRQLRYPKAWPAEPAQEKGIDVALAVDLVRLACEGAYDVGILFSRDTDLIPALETIRDLGRHVEVASWKGTSRLRFPTRSHPGATTWMPTTTPPVGTTPTTRPDQWPDRGCDAVGYGVGVGLHLSQIDEADELLTNDPLALLIGMVLDQPVPEGWSGTGWSVPA